MAANSKKEKFANARKAASATKNAAAIAEGVEPEKVKIESTKKVEKPTRSGEIKGVSFRLPVETIEKLKDLCSLTRKTATGWIITAIDESYLAREADIKALKKLQGE